MGGMQVIGVSVTDEAVAAVARRGTRPVVVEWAERVLKRHVRREKSLLVKIKDLAKLESALKADQVPVEACGRIRAAFAEKEPIYTSSKPAIAAFMTRAADTMDWIESLAESDRRIRRIDRMAWTDAEKLSEAWHLSLAKARKASKGIMDGAKKLVDTGGGNFVAELTTQGALMAEGRAMGHCVGGYWARVAAGQTRILSLRDKEGQPHATIELNESPMIEFEDGTTWPAARRPNRGVDSVPLTDSSWVAVQIRGKQNKPPVERYMKHVNEWLGQTGIPWVEYGETRTRNVDPASEVTVFTALGRHFMSAGAACDYAEPQIVEAFEKKGEFNKLYHDSGLAQIHVHPSGRDRAPAYMELFVPSLVGEFSNRLAKGSPFAVALRTSGLSTALDRMAARGGKAVKEKLFAAAIEQDAKEPSTREKVMVEVPGGRDIRIVVHSLPLMPLFVLSAGYAEGLEDKVATMVAPHLRAVLARMAADPAAVHAVKAARGGVDPDDIRRAFLFCGLAPEYASTISTVENSLSSAIRDARLSLRRARSSGKYHHELINAGSNLLADGYERRIANQASDMESGPIMLVHARERKSVPALIRRDEAPVLKSYGLP